MRCALLLLTACAAPTQVDRVEPAAWLLTGLEGAADEVAAHVEHLDAWARPLGRDSALEDRVFSPAAPDEEALSALPHTTGGPPLVSVGAASWSPRDLEAHQELLGVTDRSCLEAATTWTRTWTAGADCFPASVCDGGTAEDDVSWTLTSDYVFTLQARWRSVDLVDGRRALVGRHHLPQASASLYERYALQVWVEDPDDSGSSWRIDATWMGLDDEAVADRLLEDIALTWSRQEAALDEAPCVEPP